MRSYKALRPTGRLIVYGFSSMIPKKKGTPSYATLAYKYFKTPRFNPILMTGSNKAVMAFNLSFLFDQKDLLLEAVGELVGLVERGALEPLPTRGYPLAEAAQAHRDLESGQTVGKLVLFP
jgi:NADPH:quinone reductase-like Zn-dependent oxidoreductase